MLVKGLCYGDVMLMWVEFLCFRVCVSVCVFEPTVTFTQQIPQRRVCGCISLASVLSCHGNYSSCGFVLIKGREQRHLWCSRVK